jgi:hypothetical protein
MLTSGQKKEPLSNVDPDERTIKKTVLIVGTGNPIPDEIDLENYFFVGTVQLFDGGLVYHVFVKI